MDYPGIFTLIDIASKDYSSLGCSLLSKLAETKLIQQRTLCPLLVPQSISKDPKARRRAVLLLQRLQPSAVEPFLDELGAGLHCNPDIRELAKLVSASGEAGAKVLVRELAVASVKDKVQILEAVGSGEDPETLEIVVEERTIHPFPGQLVNWQEDEQRIVIDFTDFLAALHRMLT
jgi:hypothetical protein